MEYTNGQRVEVRRLGEWVPAIYIGRDYWSDGVPTNDHVVVAGDDPDDTLTVKGESVRPILTREERIESLLDDFEGLNRWSFIRGVLTYDEWAALFAILDAEIPE